MITGGLPVSFGNPLFTRKIMKKGIVCICMLMFALSGYGQYNDPFVVKGKITEVKVPMDITLDYRGETQHVVSKDGTFEFKGISFPTDATLKAMPHHPTLTMQDAGYWAWLKEIDNFGAVRNIFLEGTVTVNAKKSLDHVIVGGSKQQEIYESFRAKQAALQHSLNALRSKNRVEEKEDDDTEEVTPVEPSAAEKQLNKELAELKISFLERYPNSYFSLDLAKYEVDDLDLMERMVNLLGKPLHHTTLYKGLVARIAGAKANAVGNNAIDFTHDTPDGVAVSLSSYKGKYVLLDFWASWCVPCRAENPNVLAAYTQYKGRNFEVLGVSIDTDKNAWVKAVKEDKLPWVQVIDSKNGSNSAATIYAVKGVPQNFLIDPSGKIIAKDLHGEELQKTLDLMLK